MDKYKISEKEKKILRELAKKVAEIAQNPLLYSTNREMWLKHNGLKRVRPMALAFPEGAWRELLPSDVFTCEKEYFRGIEFELRSRIYYAQYMQDDNVIDDILYCPISIKDNGWGLECRRTQSDIKLGAWHIEPVLNKESDVEKLKVPDFWVDWEDTEVRYSILLELFGDILKIKKRGIFSAGICPLDKYSGTPALELKG